MPELPDVERFKTYLDATALHQRIDDVHVENARILDGVSASRLRDVLKGHSLEKSWRHGKYLFVRLDGVEKDEGNTGSDTGSNKDHDRPVLAFHFGMTGSLSYFKDLSDAPEHDRLRLDFDNGYHLSFDNQRMLGRVRLIADPEKFIADQKLGPDALAPDLDRKTFESRLAGRRGRLKSVLMNQKLVSGIGNITADEILFQARLHPETPIDSLSEESRKALWREMRNVLKTYVERGAGSGDYSDLPRSYLLHAREEGASCPRCNGKIRKFTTAGRSGYFCPACQPAPE